MDIATACTRSRWRKFITFEGGEGAGKSTQVARACASACKALGLGVVVSREPGGSAGAEAIRHVLLSGAAKPLGPHAEAILFAAARADHLRQTIQPALERGQWVISDRFADSTRIYQGVLGNVDARLIARLEKLTVGELGPDLTIILDIAPEIGLARATRRRGDAPVDRFEGEALEFHKKLREAYLELAEREPKRCVVINASADRRDRRRIRLGRGEHAAASGRSAADDPGRGLVSDATTRRDPASARDHGALRPRRGRAGVPRRLSRRPHAACLADRRPARHRQGDARLPDGALRVRASGSGGTGVQRRDIARAAAGSSARCAASPRRATATCSRSSASRTTRASCARSSRSTMVRTTIGFFGSTAGRGGLARLHRGLGRRAERRGRQRAAEDPGGAAGEIACCWW